MQKEAPEAPITLPDDELRAHRAAHPLARVFPLLDDILGQAARDTGSLMAVSDAEGQLLWVCGTGSIQRRAESIGFVEGSNWDERLAGTNAPGWRSSSAGRSACWGPSTSASRCRTGAAWRRRSTTRSPPACSVSST